MAIDSALCECRHWLDAGYRIVANVGPDAGVELQVLGNPAANQQQVPRERLIF